MCLEDGPDDDDGMITRCCLEHDHEGPHEFRRADEIMIVWVAGTKE